jgi:ribosomal protein S18 acetylase RimI-like enzyme
MKFKLFLDKTLVAESGFNIEQPDEWFNEKYVTLYNLKTHKKFQNKGYAKYFLEQIFDYVKNKIKLNIITLIVDKDNYKAINLYLKTGFKIFMEYSDSYSLIKKIN